MRTKLKFRVLVAGLGLFGAVIPVFAHHSFSADYDANKPVKVKGVVTKVEWTNPHAHYYIDVVDEKGNVTNWNFELATINVLSRNGWTSKSLKVGDRVTVEGFAGKVVANRAAASAVVLADGRALFAGAANGGDSPGR